MTGVHRTMRAAHPPPARAIPDHRSGGGHLAALACGTPSYAALLSGGVAKNFAQLAVIENGLGGVVSSSATPIVPVTTTALPSRLNVAACDAFPCSYSYRSG